MRIDLAPEDLVFREEVRAFLREKLPPDIKRKVDNGVSLRRDDIMRWHRILYERGWVAPNWPAEWGGPGWTIERKYIWDEEQGLAGAPRLISFGLNMCGPVLIRFSTDEQKRRFLPRILSGGAVWCQGYSEPDSGS